MSFPFFETFILSLFDVLQYYVITNKLNNGKIQMQWWHASALILCALCGTLFSISIEGMYALLANTLAFMVLSYILYRRSGLQLLFLHIIGMVLMQTIQLVVIFLIYAYLGKIEYTSSLGMVAQTSGLLLACLVSKYIPTHLLFRYVEAKNDLFRIISLNIFILLTFCIIYWYLHFDSIVENLIWISAIIIFVMLINLIFLRDGLKNQVIEEQNRVYQQYLPIISELMDEIRIKQHDFDNHMAALKIVLEQRKEAETTIEKVEDYILDIEAAFENADLLRMKNRIIAGFLYSKKKRSLEEKIQMDINIEDYALSTDLKDYELLDILSILIDNAFETGVSENVIKIRFYKEKSKSVIEVANKHPYIQMVKINEFFTKGFSSKSAEKRGLGLFKLKQIISKYQGELEITNTDFGENFIVFKVSLP